MGWTVLEDVFWGLGSCSTGISVSVASPQSEEGGLLVPQQLVAGITITVDTHLTFLLGAEVANG